MAQRTDIMQTTDDSRCRKCRFWFGRCCHALALLEGDDKTPCACVHFVTENAPSHRLMEVSP